MAKANVDAGICSYTVTVKATALNSKEVQVELCTDCEMITAMNEDLAHLQWKGRGHKVFLRMTESAVYESAARHIRHCACIVPAAVLKTIEVETGMALPKKATIEFEE